ncbi:MAG: spermine synthase [Actinobacteria bacterium]|nr:spermine synthase [Actinomycetota bacterium]
MRRAQEGLRRIHRLTVAIVAVVGAASLGAEIAAARLLAPWFGASTIVWANTIATVLVALSIGYWYGGRLADRDPTVAGLSRLVMIAAALLALVPFIAGPFLSVSVKALDQVEAGAFVGSLIAVMVLIAFPVMVLGAVAPYAVRLSVKTADEAGNVAGRLYAISTVGSLVGVFLSALLLVPLLGTRRTFIVFALSLALVALPALSWRWLALPLLIIVALFAPVGTIKSADASTVVWESETEYQYARVVQFSDGERWLELNEGQAVHSVYRPGSWLTNNYWDEALVLPWAARDSEPRSLAVLGNAGGTVARAYGHFYPDARVDGVEIDGQLSEAGRRYFDLRGPNLHLHTADARPFLRRSDRKWDAILVDAYRQPYIPFYMTTTEFFSSVAEHLNPGGVVMVNVGHPEGSAELEASLAATMKTHFKTVLRDPSQRVSTILLGANGPASAQQLAASANSAAMPAALRPVAREAAQRLSPPLPGGDVYTDDLAPVEWLIDGSILKVAAQGQR